MPQMNRNIRLDEKLTVLQQADTLRNWSSLDDRRVCVLCDRVISGRMIDVWQDKLGTYRLHCATPGCPATPHDWFYHGTTRAPAARVLPSRAPVIGFSLSTT